jgi:hypothetical protein
VDIHEGSDERYFRHQILQDAKESHEAFDKVESQYSNSHKKVFLGLEYKIASSFLSSISDWVQL